MLQDVGDAVDATHDLKGGMKEIRKAFRELRTPDIAPQAPETTPQTPPAAQPAPQTPPAAQPEQKSDSAK